MRFDCARLAQNVCPRSGIILVRGILPVNFIKFPYKVAFVKSWHAFRLRRLAQSLRRGFGLRHFTRKFLYQVALVKSWHAFRLRRLAQSLQRGFDLHHFTCKFPYQVALVKSWHAFRLRRLARNVCLRSGLSAFWAHSGTRVGSHKVFLCVLLLVFSCRVFSSPVVWNVALNKQTHL